MWIWKIKYNVWKYTTDSSPKFLTKGKYRFDREKYKSGEEKKRKEKKGKERKRKEKVKIMKGRSNNSNRNLNQALFNNQTQHI